MSNEFHVNESAGEKVYKLMLVFFSSRRGMKIISKESANGMIHFLIYFGDLQTDTKEFLTRELKYKSIDDGVTKKDFDEIVNEILSKMPKEVEIKIHDLSNYETLKEQYSKGIKEGFLKKVSMDDI